MRRLKVLLDWWNVGRKCGNEVGLYVFIDGNVDNDGGCFLFCMVNK